MAKVNVKAHKLQSSSVLEIVIAMLLIMIVFGIALTIFTNVTRSSLSAQKLKAQALAKEKLIQFEQGALDTSAVTNGDMRVETAINNVPDKQGLTKVEVTVYSGDRQKMATASKLIKAHE